MTSATSQLLSDFARSGEDTLPTLGHQACIFLSRRSLCCPCSVPGPCVEVAGGAMLDVHECTVC
jgi:hypothetical protein